MSWFSDLGASVLGGVQGIFGPSNKAGNLLNMGQGSSPGNSLSTAGGINSLLGVAGTYLGSDAYKNAANAANDRLNPYSQTGLSANNKLAGLAGLNGMDMQKYLESLPGYQFVRDQGLKSVQNGAAARGLGDSGAALKGAANYATGLADNTYGKQFNNLLKLTDLGQDTATKMGNINIGVGNNTANAYAAGAGAIQGGVNAGAQGNILNQLLGMFSGSGGGTGIFGSGATDLGASLPWLSGTGGTLAAGATDLGAAMPWLALA